MVVYCVCYGVWNKNGHKITFIHSLTENYLFNRTEFEHMTYIIDLKIFPHVSLFSETINKVSDFVFFYEQDPILKLAL